MSLEKYPSNYLDNYMRILEFVRKNLHEISLLKEVIGGQFTKLIRTGTYWLVGNTVIVFSCPIDNTYDSCIAVEYTTISSSD